MVNFLPTSTLMYGRVIIKSCSRLLVVVRPDNIPLSITRYSFFSLFCVCLFSLLGARVLIKEKKKVIRTSIAYNVGASGVFILFPGSFMDPTLWVPHYSLSVLHRLLAHVRTIVPEPKALQILPRVKWPGTAFTIRLSYTA